MRRRPEELQHSLTTFSTRLRKLKGELKKWFFSELNLVSCSSSIATLGGFALVAWEKGQKRELIVSILLATLAYGEYIQKFEGWMGPHVDLPWKPAMIDIYEA